jgi:hypothetical protein
MNTATETKLPDLTPEQMARFLPTSVEMHLSGSSDFTRKGWGKKVKAAGGRYSECRGDATERYVTVPLIEEDLIGDLLCLFPSWKKTTIVFRGIATWRPNAWVVVHDIPNIAAVADNPREAEFAKVAKALDEVRAAMNGRCRDEIERIFAGEIAREKEAERRPLKRAYNALSAAETALREAMDAGDLTSFNGLTRQMATVRSAYSAKFPGEHVGD